MPIDGRHHRRGACLKMRMLVFTANLNFFYLSRGGERSVYRHKVFMPIVFYEYYVTKRPDTKGPGRSQRPKANTPYCFGTILSTNKLAPPRINRKRSRQRNAPRSTQDTTTTHKTVLRNGDERRTTNQTILETTYSEDVVTGLLCGGDVRAHPSWPTTWTARLQKRAIRRPTLREAKHLAENRQVTQRKPEAHC